MVVIKSDLNKLIDLLISEQTQNYLNIYWNYKSGQPVPSLSPTARDNCKKLDGKDKGLDLKTPYYLYGRIDGKRYDHLELMLDLTDIKGLTFCFDTSLSEYAMMNLKTVCKFSTAAANVFITNFKVNELQALYQTKFPGENIDLYLDPTSPHNNLDVINDFLVPTTPYNRILTDLLPWNAKQAMTDAELQQACAYYLNDYNNRKEKFINKL